MAATYNKLPEPPPKKINIIEKLDKMVSDWNYYKKHECWPEDKKNKSLEKGGSDE